jgi:hypothetical protein
MIRCETCDGTGMKGSNGEWCKACEGEGEIKSEVTTTKVSGQAGDSSFLRIAQAAMAEVNRLQGLHKVRNKTNKSDPLRAEVLHMHLGADSAKYLNASADAIIDAKSALEKLRLEVVKAKGSGVVEGEVVGEEGGAR